MTTQGFTSEVPDQFTGAKMALLTGDKVVSILRDDKPSLPFPACWDLPGGGRDGDETPLECVLRETREELGLRVPEDALIWKRAFVSTIDPDAAGWFFVAHITADQVSRIRLGNEGQCWRHMSVAQFLRLSDAVPYLQDRLRVYLEDTNGA